MNLDGTEARGPVLYSPGKVTRALEYQAELEAKEESELKGKEARVKQRLINKELKEAKEAGKQLQKELNTQFLVAPKPPVMKPESVASKAKKATPIISKPTKVLKASIPIAKLP